MSAQRGFFLCPVTRALGNFREIREVGKIRKDTVLRRKWHHEAHPEPFDTAAGPNSSRHAMTKAETLWNHTTVKSKLVATAKTSLIRHCCSEARAGQRSTRDPYAVRLNTTLLL